MKIADIFKNKNQSKNDYYKYLKAPQERDKYNFLKSKFFIIIISLFFIVAAVIIVLQFRTAKQIQKLIFNQEFNKAIVIATTYLKDSKSEKISFLLAEALFIKSFYLKESDEANNYRARALDIFNKIVTKGKKLSSIELFAYGFLLSYSKTDMDKGVDYLKESLKENQEDGKLGAYINRRIIKINTKPLHFVDIYERIAFTLYRLKRYREATAFYKRSLKTRPKTIHYFFMALIEKNLKNYKSAKKLLNLVLNTEKNEDVRMNCYLILANIEFKQENFKKAEEFYKKTIELNSQSANSYYFLGKIYRKQKKLKLYRKYLREAARLGHKKAKTMFPSYELKEMRKRRAFGKGR